MKFAAIKPLAALTLLLPSALDSLAAPGDSQYWHEKCDPSHSPLDRNTHSHRCSGITAYLAWPPTETMPPLVPAFSLRNPSNKTSHPRSKHPSPSSNALALPKWGWKDSRSKFLRWCVSSHMANLQTLIHTSSLVNVGQSKLQTDGYSMRRLNQVVAGSRSLQGHLRMGKFQPHLHQHQSAVQSRLLRLSSSCWRCPSLH